LEDGDVATGDKITLSVHFPNLANMSEMDIVNISVSYGVGIYYQSTGALVVPNATYKPYLGPIDVAHFAWERVEGVTAGNHVNVSVNFTNEDSDIMAWWADTDNTTWTFDNNLLGGVMTTGARPEEGSFLANRGGPLAIGIFNHDRADGHYELAVDTRPGIHAKAQFEGNTAYLETWISTQDGVEIFPPHTNYAMSLACIGQTLGGIGFSASVNSLTFNNFFYPVLDEISVSGDGPIKNITWSSKDRNQNDDLYHDVLVSIDGGLSWQFIARHINDTEYVWDSTGFGDLDYIFQVRVYDNDPVTNSNPEIGEYLPGYTDRIDSASFDSPGPPPITHPSPLIDSPRDLSFTVGTPGQSISWKPSATRLCYYRVSRNGTQIQNGTWHPRDDDVFVYVSDLEPATYVFRLVIWHYGDLELATDTVVVTVLPNDSSRALLQAAGFAVFGISVTVIAIGIVLISRARSRGEGLWSKHTI
jgi:hypothetical protein